MKNIKCGATCSILFILVTLQARAEEVIAAKVNGEPITEKQINEGLPKDAFGESLASIRRFKLERLVSTVQTRQFLAQNGVRIGDKVVDAEIARQRKNPPAMSCGCCRFDTLEQFLEANYVSLDQYREEIRNDKGIDAYLDKLWTQKVPDAATAAKLVQKNRPTIEREFAKTSHIFFSGMKPADKNATPDEVAQKLKTAAQAAWQRLKNGESFATLAKDLSDDKTSAGDGGFLGCINRERTPFGAKAAAELFRLKPGEYSAVVASPWGYHILLRDALTDKDVLGVLKESFQAEQDDHLQDKIAAQSKVDFFGAYKNQK